MLSRGTWLPGGFRSNVARNRTSRHRYGRQQKAPNLRGLFFPALVGAPGLEPGTRVHAARLHEGLRLAEAAAIKAGGDGVGWGCVRRRLTPPPAHMVGPASLGWGPRRPQNSTLASRRK